MRPVRLFLPIAFTVLLFGPSFASAQPGQATLVSSADAGANSFTWNAVTGATYYYLWVNEGTTPKHQLWYTSAQAGCANGELTCRVNVVLPNMNFVTGYWWIQTWSPAGYGPWSSPQTFAIRPPRPAVWVDANNRYIGTESGGNALVDINGLPATTVFRFKTFAVDRVLDLFYTAGGCAGQSYAYATDPDVVVFRTAPAAATRNAYLIRGAVLNMTVLSKRQVAPDGLLSECVAENTPWDVMPITLVDLTSQFGSFTPPFRLVR